MKRNIVPEIDGDDEKTKRRKREEWIL